MKKFALTCLSILAFGYVALADWTSESLDLARKDDSQAIVKISAERAEMRARLAKLSSEILEVDTKLKKLSEQKTEYLSLSDKSEFYDSLQKKMLILAERGFSKSADNGNTFLELSDFLSRCNKELQDEIFNPFVGKKSKVKRAKSGEFLEGEIFRVGAFSYFVSENAAGFVSDGILYGEEFASDIRDFYMGKSRKIPADISAGALLAKTEKSRSFVDDVVLGGVWIYPILFFGALSIGVFVMKLFLFLSIRRAPKDVIKRISSALSSDDLSKAEKIAKSAGYPYAGLLSELIKSRKLGTTAMEEISYEQMLSVGERLFSGLSVLSVSAAVAPLFGLLGTVTGIIKTFGDLSMRGAEQAQFISAGISEALITTEYGLIVAIPAFVAHAILSRRAKGILSDMEKLASSFLATFRE